MGALWLGPEAELHYMRARRYEAGTGRFLSEDPLGLAGGVNPYVYAGSAPVNGSDPSGTCASNEVLCVRFVREGDGGITVLGYFCRSAGGGDGVAGPSGPASGQTRQPCSAQTTESQALFGGSFLVGGPRVPSGLIGGGLNVGLTSSGRVFIQLTGSVSGGVGAYVGYGIGISRGRSNITPTGRSSGGGWIGMANAAFFESVGVSVSPDDAGFVSRELSTLQKLGHGFGAVVSAGRFVQGTLASPSFRLLRQLFNNSCQP